MHHEVGLLVVATLRPFDVAQPGGQEHAHRLVGEPRGCGDVDQHRPALRDDTHLLGELAPGGHHRVLVSHVQ